ncbi:MAG: DnaJ C-terminal domain-containing protein [Armatimonadota bacterium]|nr:DnaJ C-terminal domain-containing protein [Armatimonadota bacterium]
MQFKDYYQILGVERNADQKTISRAFRRLARESHPDVNKKKGAEDRFKEINEAYQVLGDPEKRAKYDQIYDAYKNGGMPWQDLFGRVAAAPGAYGGPGGVTFEVGSAEDLEWLFGRGAGGGGFSDFFQQLFGGLGGFGRTATRTQTQTRVHAPHTRLESTLEITLEEAFHGARRQIRIPDLGRSFDVEIPKGIRSGQTIRLAGAADGQDLYLTVQIAPHRLFERTDDDLTVEVPITMSEAALGGQVEVPTIDGGHVTMTVPSETQTGRRFRLKGLGMPRARGDGRGDLYVRVKVVTPTALTPKERELFEELRRLRKENPRQHLRS